MMKKEKYEMNRRQKLDIKYLNFLNLFSIQIHLYHSLAHTPPLTNKLEKVLIITWYICPHQRGMPISLINNSFVNISQYY